MTYRLVKKSDGYYYLQYANCWLPIIGNFYWSDSSGDSIANREAAIQKLHRMNILTKKKTIVEIVA